MPSTDNTFGSFLASRRAKVTPEQIGLPVTPNRRVPGLRRNELAVLAGISVEYLARLERGVVRGVSESVLDSLSRALQLDEAEHEHLLDLARTITGTARPPRKRKPAIRPSVQHILDAITTAPALVRNGRADILATNPLGRALYSEMYVQPGRPVNHARFIFLDPRAHHFYVDWDGAANDIVAILRTEAGRDPFDRDLTDLVGELSTRSDEFRTRWAEQNVRRHYTGRKHFHHPAIGDIHLNFEAMSISADEGLTLLIYPATPETPDADALQILATWQATPAAMPQDIEGPL
ncbi:helix-turn-helix transcriptional regulator [Plantibacter sp. YIM 135347]|uniref:helix-turn-helix transcriptional regulator n=1 Tax=Plantibacter sp. YIM 135347 TaxID=3423919 RepID=UPI003D354FA0